MTIETDNRITENIDLSCLTTLRTGGTARYFFAPHTVEALREALAWSRRNRLPVFVLGKGSNVLISDRGWPGLVVHLAKNFSSIRWTGACRVECLSGTPLSSVISRSIDRGCAGMEKLAGIPGSVGGAVVGNAGAFERQIADVLVSCDVVDCATGEIVTMKSGELQFGYRSSMLQRSDAVIARAVFRFSKSDPARLRRQARDTLSLRKSKQPAGLRNCGSVFKNPPGQSAGALIERCGLKGKASGGAKVSEKHANFIIAGETATSTDVYNLICLVRRNVADDCGIVLEPEVRLVGEFEH